MTPLTFYLLVSAFRIATQKRKAQRNGQGSVILANHYWETLEQTLIFFISHWHSDQVFSGHDFLSLIGG